MGRPEWEEGGGDNGLDRRDSCKEGGTQGDPPAIRPGLHGSSGSPAGQGRRSDRRLYLHRVSRRPRSEEGPGLPGQAPGIPTVLLRSSEVRPGVAELRELLHLPAATEREDEGAVDRKSV